MYIIQGPPTNTFGPAAFMSFLLGLSVAAEKRAGKIIVKINEIVNACRASKRDAAAEFFSRATFTDVEFDEADCFEKTN